MHARVNSMSCARGDRASVCVSVRFLFARDRMCSKNRFRVGGGGWGVFRRGVGEVQRTQTEIQGGKGVKRTGEVERERERERERARAREREREQEDAKFVYCAIFVNVSLFVTMFTDDNYK